jgi:hypothetical protein
MSWRPYPPAVAAAHWYRKTFEVVREVFFSPRIMTQSGGGANVVDALYAVAEATEHLANEVARFNDTEESA